MRRLAIAVALLVSGSATADPLRLRADALATSASPAGLLVLEGEGAPTDRLQAEAVVWMAGSRSPGEGASGDVLVIALRGQTRSGRIGGRVGRFVSMLGALRPVHVDGGALRLRLPYRFDVETVAGIPVTPLTLSGRSWDWMVGGRVARRIRDYGSTGLAYGQRRDAGQLASEELGLDAGAAFTKRHDAGARVAYDLANRGLAEIALTASYRRKALRIETYAIHRDASHLLPATSLFSVIGDIPSQRVGTTFTWRAAPRLDIVGDVALRHVDPDLGAEVTARAVLRLDDRGKSSLATELRRGGVADDAWTGARGVARLALPRELVLATELELVIPDLDRGTGRVWPWGLVALGRDVGAWHAAMAVEASASPTYTGRVDVLAQLGRRWEIP